CTASFGQGNYGAGYTSDNFNPEPMGLLPPISMTVVDWPTIVQDWTWGFPSNVLGMPYGDEAILFQWSPNTANAGTITEIARGSYGVPPCSMCFGNLEALTFHPEHIKWDPATKTYSPNPFLVEALLFNNSNNSGTDAHASI